MTIFPSRSFPYHWPLLTKAMHIWWWSVCCDAKDVDLDHISCSLSYHSPLLTKTLQDQLTISPKQGKPPCKEYKAAISGWYQLQWETEPAFIIVYLQKKLSTGICEQHTCRWRCFVDFFSLFCRWRITIIAFARQCGETFLLSHKDFSDIRWEFDNLCFFSSAQS